MNFLLVPFEKEKTTQRPVKFGNKKTKTLLAHLANRSMIDGIDLLKKKWREFQLRPPVICMSSSAIISRHFHRAEMKSYPILRDIHDW